MCFGLEKNELKVFKDQGEAMQYLETLMTGV